MKLLIAIFAAAAVLGTVGCIWENNNRKPCYAYYAHCEVHADRDIESIVQEAIRDAETEQDRAEREISEAYEKSAQEAGLGNV